MGAEACGPGARVLCSEGWRGTGMSAEDISPFARGRAGHGRGGFRGDQREEGTFTGVRLWTGCGTVCELRENDEPGMKRAGNSVPYGCGATSAPRIPFILTPAGEPRGPAWRPCGLVCLQGPASGCTLEMGGDRIPCAVPPPSPLPWSFPFGRAIPLCHAYVLVDGCVFSVAF